jgi:hypothetical protein
VLTRAVQTAVACPSQWDAWDADGNYYYLRFRHGCGEMRQYKSENWVDAPWIEADKTRPGWGIRANAEYIRTVATFEHGDPLDGDISLVDFARLAGVKLHPDIYRTTYGQHLKDGLIMEGINEVPAALSALFSLGDEDTGQEQD